jgi:hypothetical protein
MEHKLPVQHTGKWVFHLQQEKTLQFHITSEQEANGQILIEGHEISALLDYLYDHRELIYDATHDQALRHLEALEAYQHVAPRSSTPHRIQPVRYFDDGEQRRRADI